MSASDSRLVATATDTSLAKSWRIAFALIALVALSILVACGDSDDDQTATPAEPVQSSSGSFSLADAAAPYEGTELRILDELTDFQPAMAKLLPQFEHETGIDVEYELLSHDDVIRKGEADLLSGQGAYDAVMIHSEQAGRLLQANAIQFLNDYLDDAALHDPSVEFADFQQPLTDQFTDVDGNRIGFPNWLYTYVYWARKDLLTNPIEKEAFKREYGYELQIPQTMEQMRDIAEFFDRAAGEKAAGEVLDQDLAGIVLQGDRAGGGYYDAAYNFMKNAGGGLFAEDGTPAVDNPENVAGLALYRDLWGFGPPGMAEVGLVDLPVMMGQGIAASGIIFSDFVFNVDKKGESPFAGQFAYGAVPAFEGQPDAHTAGVSPSTLVINSASDNKEATYLLLQWMVSPEVQKEWLKSGVGIPVRTADFELVKNGPRAGLYQAIQDSQDVAKPFPPTVPNMFEIVNEVALMQQRVGAGESTPEDAVADLQSKMEDICEGGSCFVSGSD